MNVLQVGWCLLQRAVAAVINEEDVTGVRDAGLLSLLSSRGLLYQLASGSWPLVCCGVWAWGARAGVRKRLSGPDAGGAGRAVTRVAATAPLSVLFTQPT